MIKYIAFRSPVTLGSQGSTNAWEVNRMSNVQATKLQTREWKFTFKSGEYVIVGPDNIGYELYAAETPQTAEKGGNVVPKVKA